MNLFNDAVSPIPPPNESILLRYFRPSDHHDFSISPNFNRSIGNYHKSSSTKSSCGSNKSPLSAVKNLEDDVLVMDGILVNSNKALKSSGKFRSSSSTLSESSSSSNSGSNFYKTEICKTWENTGTCRYGYKCQFAHGKEELRYIPNRVRPQKRLDLLNDPYFSPQSSASSGSSKYALEKMVSPSSAKKTDKSKLNKASPIQLKDVLTPDRNLTSPYWSPLDDGIAVQLPSAHGTPSRKAVDVYIDNLLYGCAEKKRLPVFVDICPK